LFDTKPNSMEILIELESRSPNALQLMDGDEGEMMRCGLAIKFFDAAKQIPCCRRT